MTPDPAMDLRIVYLDGSGRDGPPPAIDWLWDGYLAPGNVTLLTSQWKAGKTTLVSVLLARLAGGGTLAGRAVRAGRAVVVSEEPIANWEGRNGGRPFGGHVGFLCRPFRDRPTADQWAALIDHLAAEHAGRPLDLVVIDPLASFLPARTENDAGTVLAALLPLQRLTAAGVAVLILHHPRKAESAPGRAARGSGALTGYVDVLIEMDCFGPAHEDDRRRKLSGFSRHARTPRRLAIEWTADEADYVSLGDFAELDREAGWPVLRGVLEDADRKLTRRGIRDRWPADYECPSDVTLWRWLERARADGQVERGGTGRGRQPFEYWLPGKAEAWAAERSWLPPLPDLPVLRGE